MGGGELLYERKAGSRFPAQGSSRFRTQIGGPARERFQTFGLRAPGTKREHVNAAGGRRRKVAGTLEGARSQRGADSRTRPSPRPRAPPAQAQARKMAAAGVGRLRRAASALLLRAPRLPARELSAPARLYHKKVRATGGSAGGGGAGVRGPPRGLRVLAEAQPSRLCAALQPRL